jgi:2-amino-4-hydroxy-6-hydroxymethyldihydropteridine diphosphokinase
MRHPRHGRPEAVLRAALLALADGGMAVEAASPIVPTAPLGPTRRRFANAAAVVASALPPPAVLARLKAIERGFGRRRRGRRWGPRVLDLDIILWSGGAWRSPGLMVPHPGFRERRFVLLPSRRIAAGWRDPLSGLTIAQLAHRLTRRA